MDTIVGKSPLAPLACLIGRKKTAKEGYFASLCKREVRRDFIRVSFGCGYAAL